jgi:hypothetical protein
MVSNLVQYLVQKEVRITGVSLQGEKQPNSVNGKVPEVEGIDATGQFPIYGESEECERYANDRTRGQLEAFSRYRNAQVYLLVPAACFASAKDYIERSFPGRNITVLSYNGQ